MLMFYIDVFVLYMTKKHFPFVYSKCTMKIGQDSLTIQYMQYASPPLPQQPVLWIWINSMRIRIRIHKI